MGTHCIVVHCRYSNGMVTTTRLLITGTRRRLQAWKMLIRMMIAEMKTWNVESEDKNSKLRKLHGKERMSYRIKCPSCLYNRLHPLMQSSVRNVPLIAVKLDRGWHKGGWRWDDSYPPWTWTRVTTIYRKCDWANQTPSFSFRATNSWDPIVHQHFNRCAISFFPSLQGVNVKHGFMNISVSKRRANWSDLSFFSHSALICPPSLQSVTSSASDNLSGSLLSDCSSFRAHSLPRSFLDCDAHTPSVSSFLIFVCEHNGGSSFSTSDSMAAAATRFGTNGKVTNARTAPSGVIIRRLRQIGQSTDSCQPPQARCKREKNHLRMQRAQNVWPQWPGFNA